MIINLRKAYKINKSDDGKKKKRSGDIAQYGGPGFNSQFKKKVKMGTILLK